MIMWNMSHCATTGDVPHACSLWGEGLAICLHTIQVPNWSCLDLNSMYSWFWIQLGKMYKFCLILLVLGKTWAQLWVSKGDVWWWWSVNVNVIDNRDSERWSRSSCKFKWCQQFKCLWNHKLPQMSCSRCESTKTTRIFMMRLKQRSRPSPRPFSADNVDFFCSGKCIFHCRLLVFVISAVINFCSIATNAKNVIAATNCYCNHEKSAEPRFFSAAPLW